MPSFRPATAAEVRELDRRAIEEHGVPGVVLMENAGRSATEIAVAMVGTPQSGMPIAIVCGKGNNGGDGFVMARHLHNRGYPVEVFLTHPPGEIKGDARINLDIVLRMRTIPVRVFGKDFDLQVLQASLSRSALVLDGLLGTGLSGSVRPPFDDFIQAINASGRPVLAIDIPSGLNSDTGEILGHCVRATETVTFALPKKGFFLNQGPAMTGKLTVANIGMPVELLRPFLEQQ